jgi:thioredoxin 1
MSNATPITDATFDDEVIRSDVPVLVDFWAEWCQPCKLMAPVLDEVAGDQSGKMKIAKMDVDSNQTMPDRYGIMSIPTMVLFKDGQEVERATGYMSKAQLMRRLERHLQG